MNSFYNQVVNNSFPPKYYVYGVPGPCPRDDYPPKARFRGMILGKRTFVSMSSGCARCGVETECMMTGRYDNCPRPVWFHCADENCIEHVRRCIGYCQYNDGMYDDHNWFGFAPVITRSSGRGQRCIEIGGGMFHNQIYVSRDLDTFGHLVVKCFWIDKNSDGNEDIFSKYCLLKDIASRPENVWFPLLEINAKWEYFPTEGVKHIQKMVDEIRNIQRANKKWVRDGERVLEEYLSRVVVDLVLEFWIGRKRIEIEEKEKSKSFKKLRHNLV